MSESWARRLHERELGAPMPQLPPPQPNGGILILDESHTHRNAAAIPGGILTHLLPGSIHYLDLGGIKVRSLLVLGGSPGLWQGITKLYASNCQLRSLDGLENLTNCRYLYLDGNELDAAELKRLCHEIPHGLLEVLDLSGNPGVDEAVPGLFASPVLSRCEYLNGKRLRDIER